LAKIFDISYQYLLTSFSSEGIYLQMYILRARSDAKNIYYNFWKRENYVYELCMFIPINR